MSDEIWIAYRAGLGATPVSVALGELVTREVGRMARRRDGDAEGIRVALDDARELAGELASLIERLERTTGMNGLDEQPCCNADLRCRAMAPH